MDYCRPKSPLQILGKSIIVERPGKRRRHKMAAAISASWAFAGRRWGSRHPLACSLSSSSPKTRRLVLYSKPGCCLCDGLKEKLQAAFSLSSPDSLHDVILQVRDITTNPEWERAYQYEIPVLAKLNSDGKEELLPRLSPRLSVEIIQKKLAAAFS